MPVPSLNFFPEDEFRREGDISQDSVSRETLAQGLEQGRNPDRLSKTADVIGAVGGMGTASKGRPTRAQLRQAEFMEQEKFQMQKFRVGLDMIGALNKTIEGKSAPEQAALKQYFGAQMEKFFPGASEFLTTTYDSPEVQATIAGINASGMGEVYGMLSGYDPVKAYEIHNNPETRELIDGIAIRGSQQSAQDKIGNFFKNAANISPEAAKIANKEIKSFDDVLELNKMMPENERLTEMEMRAVEKYPRVLMSNGVLPDKEFISLMT